MLSPQAKPEEKWEVKPEVLEQLKTKQEQPKTNMLILESYTESSSEDTTSNLSGKEVVSPTQDVEHNSSSEEL